MSVSGVGLTLLAACLAAALVRVLRGPTDADRVAAVEFAFLVVVAAIALLAVRLGSSALLDVVITTILVGFVATVALARLLGRR